MELLRRSTNSGNHRRNHDCGVHLVSLVYVRHHGDISCCHDHGNEWALSYPTRLNLDL
ncbi:hypothetical protein ASPCADRAFT_210864 [Aspergillus carbonarius ITEM 5010]|uniref:Uncharacterized protein n=1 Tax=Aspergillus carbonarius (strain ITEM 5010) TaxID=602072 RepID=A0A1R3RC09_ASPC5|nr:hypothetical protein ASPCADRAFT_210864 [Aspergillus carbonarius ITEM 5010]